MNHLTILDKIKTSLSADKNVLAFFVFGSVSKGAFHKDSDIDTGIVYVKFNPGYEFSIGYVDGIKIGYSKWSEEKLRQRVETNPYRLYVFAHAKILFDKSNIRILQTDVLNYLQSHPEVIKQWEKYNMSYEKEKQKYGEGKTSIFKVYKELDKKFGRK